MTNLKKYLSQSELADFLAFCERKKIKQKDIAAICIEGEDTISKALSSERFKRTNARLVIQAKKKESDKEFKGLEF